MLFKIVGIITATIIVLWVSLVVGLIVLISYPDSGPYMIAGAVAVVVGAAAIYYRYQSVHGGGQKIPADASRVYDKAPRGYKMEALMRYYINQYAKSPFAEVRGIDKLDWLSVPDESAPDGRVYLDLDSYNPECKVAFEFNGPLHYKCPSSQELRRWLVGRYNDKAKQQLCKDAGVQLFIIDQDSLDREYIMSRLWEAGCLSDAWITSTGERKGFSFIERRPEKPHDHADMIDKITRVRRFGASSPVLEGL